MAWPVSWGEVINRVPKVKDAHDLWRTPVGAGDIHQHMGADGWMYNSGPNGVPMYGWWRWGN